MGDLFNTATALGRATVATILAFDVVVACMAVLAFIREWVVPGSAHQREIARNDKLEAANDKLADALDRMSQIMESARRR